MRTLDINYHFEDNVDAIVYIVVSVRYAMAPGQDPNRY